MIWQPLGSSGSLGTVPRLPGYYELLRRPAFHPVCLLWFQLTVPPCARLFDSPRGVGHPPRDRGYLGCGFPNRCSDGGDGQGLPGSWGTPCERAPLFDPGGTLSQAIAALGCCLPCYRRRRLPRLKPFEAQSRGLFTRCLRFVAWVTPVLSRHARLASGCWPALPGGGGYPPGPIARFQVVYVILPPRPGLTWRTDRLFHGCFCALTIGATET